MKGGVSVGAGSVSVYGFCAGSPDRTYSIAGVPATCAGATVSFNADGTLDEDDLRRAEQYYPGCFG